MDAGKSKSSPGFTSNKVESKVATDAPKANSAPKLETRNSKSDIERITPNKKERERERDKETKKNQKGEKPLTPDKEEKSKKSPEEESETEYSESEGPKVVLVKPPSFFEATTSTSPKLHPAIHIGKPVEVASRSPRSARGKHKNTSPPPSPTADELRMAGIPEEPEPNPLNFPKDPGSSSAPVSAPTSANTTPVRGTKRELSSEAADECALPKSSPRLHLIASFSARKLIEELKGGDGSAFTKFFELMEKEGLDGQLRFTSLVPLSFSTFPD